MSSDISDLRKPGLTIHDVAKMAGVSAKTVSRVVNDEAGVSHEKRALIARIISEVGYYPHTGARSMRKPCRDSVGVTFPAPVEQSPLSQQFLLWLFAEIYRLFCKDGGFVCFDLNPFAKNRDEDYARGLWQQRYGACIVAGPLAVNDTTAHRIQASGHPYLAMGRLDSLPDISCATVDYEEAAYLSAKYLIDKGHKRIAMLRAFEGYQPGVERLRGYLRALEEAEIPFDENLVRPVTFDALHLASVTHRLLLDPTVTALIECSGSEDAASVREGARRAGRVPGQDFDVVVWTYTDNAAVLNEAAAHIWLPAREAAAEGLELLADWVQERRTDPIKVIYRPTLYHPSTDREIPKPKPLFDVLLNR
ncbi:MAG: LacI family DNA-binding transcriptional regulator [Candidatus Hydrogenedentes bacterium]|nr:LacI family DNA-binding transcriptional regulator [Candidatus Hydrogenedentota bacterium]